MEAPNIQVGIKNGKEIHFKLNGKYKIDGLDQNFYGKCSARIEEDTIQIRNCKTELSIKESVVLEPSSFTVDFFEVSNVTIGVDFHWEQEEDQKFLGALKLILNKDTIEVVNILPLETYLRSVISSEMSPKSSLELLKAHAIVSRSWLLAQIVKKDQIKASKKEYHHESITENEIIRWWDREDHELFDVCADDHCQRYQGVQKITHNKVIEALNQTYGQVIKYNDEICDARYSKCCGGISETFENVWEPKEYGYLTKIIDAPEKPKEYALDLKNENNAHRWIVGNPESFCNTRDEFILGQILQDYDLSFKDFYRWEITYSQKEIQELIATKLNMDLGNILDFKPVERGVSGRLVKLKIIGQKKSITIGKELEIRRVLSKSHLYSSAIVIEKGKVVDSIPEAFMIKGAGWGHGVGLCQIGAAVMGEQGYTSDQIIEHYFKNVSIERIY